MRMFDKGKVVNLLGVCIIFSLIPILIEGLIQQIILQTKGSGAVSYNSQLSVIVFTLCLFVLAIYRNLVIKEKLLTLTLFITCIYLIIMLPYYSFINNPGYALAGYSSIFFIFISMVVIILPQFIKERNIIITIYILTAITSLLGVLQYFTSSPIVVVADPTTSFKLGDYLFYEVSPPKVRGFSLFYNALDFGYFLIFSLGVIIFTKDKMKFFTIALIILAIYCTITRNIYIGSVIALGAIYSFSKVKANKLILYTVPILSLLIGIFVSNINSGDAGISSSDSLQTRKTFWKMEIDRQDQNSLFNIIFGQGIFQSGDSNNSKLFVDNTYLLIVAQFGLIGLIIISLLYYAILRSLIKNTKRPISYGLYGFMSALPFLAMFNISIQPLTVFLFLYVSSRNSGEIRKKE